MAKSRLDSKFFPFPLDCCHQLDAVSCPTPSCPSFLKSTHTSHLSPRALQRRRRPVNVAPYRFLNLSHDGSASVDSALGKDAATHAKAQYSRRASSPTARTAGRGPTTKPHRAPSVPRRRSSLALHMYSELWFAAWTLRCR
ncbi:hypothetical protein G6O67_000876 [Ophiocordyceps sinensis]|uniref:Uncharacterized protein n=1 Tax=Ophiocordyceps sinensis TaxID=72228 RepID=A0A8H4Q0D6_9HYPO|nr:hypothetical protein G6O67_000876 [Ophiocordyceps sinensis]